jgi:transposase
MAANFPSTGWKSSRRVSEYRWRPPLKWEIVERKADKIYPLYEELVRQAAQGKVLHNDDTNAKILEFMNRQDDEFDEQKKERKGMFTTAVLSRAGNNTVALYFTGRKHAGENMSHLLSHRDADRGPPIQMCDALSRNLPKPFKVILANCLSHARRKFVDVTEVFPEHCRFVIEKLKEVYTNEAETKQKKLSDEARLRYHQEHSGPLINEFKEWLQEQFDQKNGRIQLKPGRGYFVYERSLECAYSFPAPTRCSIG